MALGCVIRGFLQQSGSLAGLLQHSAAAGAVAALQKRNASSHAENTNTFLREVIMHIVNQPSLHLSPQTRMLRDHTTPPCWHPACMNILLVGLI
jgi:hypothetical protein